MDGARKREGETLGEGGRERERERENQREREREIEREEGEEEGIYSRCIAPYIGHNTGHLYAGGYKLKYHY